MSTPRLAVVGPLPPSWSGIADYTARLLPHLQEAWDVVAVVPDGEPLPGPDAVDCPVVHSSSWPWVVGATNVDRMLVCLGNSRFHIDAPAILTRHGGVVLAHDVRMTALQCLIAVASPDPHYLSSVVANRHGPELAGVIRRIEDRTSIASAFSEARRRLEDVNALLLRPTIGRADRVVVHSETAARLAALELGDRAAPPIDVVPFGHPRPAEDHDRGGSVVAAFGMIAPEKQPDKLIESFAIAMKEHPAAELRLVGEAGPAYLDHLRAVAQRCGVAPSVTFTGRCDPSAYEQHLRQATIAVQLRSVVNGEASASLADCFAHGLPVVVSRVGAQAELPPDVADQTPVDASPEQLAAQISSLLANGARRKRLSEGCIQWAEQHSFAAAAAALTQVLRAAPPLTT